jgi:hypothetical protein
MKKFMAGNMKFDKTKIGKILYFFYANTQEVLHIVYKV